MKLKTRLIIFFLLFILIGKNTQAQYYFYNEDYYDSPLLVEIGGSVGAMNCLSSIGGHKGYGGRLLKDLNVSSSNLSGGIYADLLYKGLVGLRLEYTVGRVGAADSVLKANTGGPSDTRYDRNLSFRSPISEFAAIAEIYPTYIFRKFDADVSLPKAAPYIMIGVGFYHFNPQALYKGQWVDLQPLHTEGEGFSEFPDRPNYKLNQMNIPMGIGVKYELSARVNLRAEFLFRKLFTDYLDDVGGKSYIDPSIFQLHLKEPFLSEALALNYRGYEIGKDHDHNPGAPRGNIYKKKNDAYFTFGIKAGFLFGRARVK